MMTDKKSATHPYRVSNFEPGSAERNRLSLQARVFLDRELPLLSPLIKEGATVVDLGCGTGEITAALASLFPATSFVGTDSDEAACGACRAANPPAPNLQFRAWDLLGGSPCPVESPDLLYMRLVLMHLPHPQQILKTLAGALKPGACLYVADTDDRDFEFSPSLPWQEVLVETMQQVQQARGGSRRLGRELGAMLKEAGLKDVDSVVLRFEKNAGPGPDFADLFLPVASMYLEASSLPDSEIRAVRENLSAFLQDPASRFSLSLRHAWGFC